MEPMPPPAPTTGPNTTNTIRAIVTILVGAGTTALANWLRTKWGLVLVVDELTKATIISGCTAFASATYYAIVASLERRWPAFGYLLGVRKCRGPNGAVGAPEGRGEGPVT